MVPSTRSWVVLRAVVLGLGLPYLALSLGGACLDYAGEELMRVCEAVDASTQSSSTGVTPGSGSGSGSILLPSDTAADCGANAPASGGGSTSAAP